MTNPLPLSQMCLSWVLKNSKIASAFWPNISHTLLVQMLLSLKLLPLFCIRCLLNWWGIFFSIFSFSCYNSKQVTSSNWINNSKTAFGLYKNILQVASQIRLQYLHNTLFPWQILHQMIHCKLLLNPFNYLFYFPSQQ